jgi:2-iminobutanoate/2-iminopropanoate deaminase
MSDRRVIFADGAPKPHSPSYSHAVEAGGFVFCSGQMGQDPADNSLSGDSYAQAAQALRNLDAALEPAGCSLDDAVKLTVFLVDWDRDYEGVNRALNERLTDVTPVRSTVEVRKLAKGGLVEIDAVVVAGG